jgi:glycosyltransferase involved in cell wall biosynthesis
MRILFFLRLDVDGITGGDAVEARVLARALAARGHEAKVASSLSAPGGTWDVVHLFNLDRAAELGSFLDANRGFAGASVVFSPLLSWESHDAGARAVGLQGRVARSMRGTRSVANLARASALPSRQWRPGAAVEQLAARADGLVFHTAAEEQAFRRSYPRFHQPSAVIAPPLEAVAADPAMAGRVQSLRPYLACVGRIEPLKNQRWLLRSGIANHLDLVFAGAVNPKRPLYATRFQSDLRRCGRAHFLGPLDRSEVVAVLESAVAHVLPSRAENFGLVTLEALGLGREAMIPGGHPAATVLGDAIHVFDLRDPASVLARVEAIRSGHTRAHRFAREQYDPASVAARLVAHYDEVRAAARRRDAIGRIGST